METAPERQLRSRLKNSNTPKAERSKTLHHQFRAFAPARAPNEAEGGRNVSALELKRSETSGVSNGLRPTPQVPSGRPPHNETVFYKTTPFWRFWE
jgi:hypothetical protein